VATIEGVRVSLPRGFEGKLRGLEREHVVVAHVDGQWRTCIWRGGGQANKYERYLND